MNPSQPPVLVGEKIFWLGSGSGLPKPGIIRWIGHLPEIGQQDWTVGIELVRRWSIIIITDKIKLYILYYNNIILIMNNNIIFNK